MHIAWDEFDTDDLDDLDEAGVYDFFAITKRGKLLYIGMAYLQDVVQEVNNTFRAFDVDPEGHTVWLGWTESTSYGRITEQIVRAVESALINVNKPEWNTQSKENYTGRAGLKITTEGCPLLVRLIHAH